MDDSGFEFHFLKTSVYHVMFCRQLYPPSYEFPLRIDHTIWSACLPDMRINQFIRSTSSNKNSKEIDYVSTPFSMKSARKELWRDFNIWKWRSDENCMTPAKKRGITISKLVMSQMTFSSSPTVHSSVWTLWSIAYHLIIWLPLLSILSPLILDPNFNTSSKLMG